MSSNQREGDLRPDGDCDKPPTKAKVEDSAAFSGGLYKYLQEREVKISDTEKQCEEYAAKLSNIKARSSVRSPKCDTGAETTAKGDKQSPGSKSLMLLRQKTNENRAMFEQRGRELSENKRGLQTRLEQLQAQLNERDSTIRELMAVRPAAPDNAPDQVQNSEDRKEQEIAAALRERVTELEERKEREIAALRERVFELEGVVIGLQENLLEKDSVIDARTKAIALMSEDLCRKGKSTLDHLEETKEEMRLMQCNFVAHEAEMKTDKEHLMAELAEKDRRLRDLEAAKARLERDIAQRDAPQESSVARDNVEISSLRNEVAKSSAYIEELGNRIVEIEEEKELSERQQANHLATLHTLHTRLAEMEELKVKAELKAVQLEEEVDKFTLQLSSQVNQEHEEHQDQDKSTEDNSTIDKLSEQLNEKISFIDAVEAQLSSVLGVGSLDDWVKEITQWKSKISILEDTVVCYEDNCLAHDSLKEELEASIAEVGEKTQIITNLLDHMSKCQTELESRDKELQMATSNHSKQQEKMRKLIVNLKARSAELKDYKGKVSQLDSIIEQKNAVIANLEANESKAAVWKQAVEESMRQAEEEKLSRQQLLTEAQLQAEDCREELNQTLANLVQEESYRSKLEREFSTFKAQHSKEVHEAKNNIAVLESELSNAEERIKLLMEELHSKKEHIETLQADIQSTKVLSNSSLAELTAVVSNLQTTISNKERDSMEQITKLKATIEDLESFGKTRDVAVNELAVTQDQLAACKAACLEADLKLQEQTSAMNYVVADLKNAMDKIYQLELSLAEREEMFRASKAKQNEILRANENVMQTLEYYKNQITEQSIQIETKSAELKIALDLNEEWRVKKEVLNEQALAKENEQTAALETLSTEVRLGKETAHQLEQSLRDRDEMLAQLKEQSAEMSKAVQDATNKLSEQAAGREELAVQLTNALDQINVLQRMLSECDELLRARDATNNEQAGLIEIVKAELKHYVDKACQLENSLMDQDEIQKMHAEKYETLSLQLTEKQATTSEVEILQAKLESEKESNEEYRMLVSDLQTQLTQLLSTTEQHVEEIARLKTELKSSAELYEQNYVRVTDELQGNANNLKELHSQYELCENKCQVQFETLEKLLAEKQAVEAALEEAENELKNFKSRAEELKSKLGTSEEFASAFQENEKNINDKINGTLQLLTQYSSEIEASLANKEETIVEYVRQLQEEVQTRVELERSISSLQIEHESKMSALIHENKTLLDQLNTVRVSIPLPVDVHGNDGLHPQVGPHEGLVPPADPSDPWMETDEGWGWGTDEARLEEQHQTSQQRPTPPDLHLREQIVALEQKVEELELEKGKVSSELRAAQVRSGKLLKQLKDLKAKELQVSGFSTLDQAMEKEFTNRIATLDNEVLTLKELNDSLLAENQRLKNHIDSFEWQLSALKDDKVKLSNLLVESRKFQGQDNSKEVQSIEVEHSYCSKVENNSNLLEKDCEQKLMYTAKEFDNLKAYCEELQNDLTQSETKVSELGNALMAQSNEADRQLRALDVSQAEVCGVCKVNEKSTQAAVDGRQSALASADDDRKNEGDASFAPQIIPSQAKELEIMSEQIKQLSNTLKLKENEVEALKKYQIDLELDYSTRFEKNLIDVENIRMSLLSKDEQIAIQREEINKLKVDLSVHMAEVDQLRHLLNSKSQKVSDLQEDLLAQDEEADTFKARLEGMAKEIKEQQTVIQLLKSVQERKKMTPEETREDAQELDTALYLLHLKEVRCDEMTLEVVQLLEERDTLQLRLSTALQENLEMSRNVSLTPVSSSPVSVASSAGASPVRASSAAASPAAPPPVAASPANTTRTLEHKLDQVRSVSREQRQRALQQQQRTGDAVDASFTLSRDVQSQPETFMNWLWGRSTPRVTDI